MTTPPLPTAPSRKWTSVKILVLALLALAFLLLVYGYITVDHESDDWNYALRPAALAMLHGQSPYGAYFYSVPWGLLPLIPIAALPASWSRFLLFVISFGSFVYLAFRLTSKPISILLFLTSFPVLACLTIGNIDWLPMFAFITPAPFAFILAVIKPQIGLGIILYHLYRSWDQGGIRLVLKNILPVTLLLLASVVLYGPSMLQLPDLSDVSWNIALFPYTIPFGLFLLITAIIKRAARPSMSAGILFSPYYSWISLSALLIGLLERPTLLFVAWGITWGALLVLTIFR